MNAIRNIKSQHMPNQYYYTALAAKPKNLKASVCFSRLSSHDQPPTSTLHTTQTFILIHALLHTTLSTYSSGQ